MVHIYSLLHSCHSFVGMEMFGVFCAHVYYFSCDLEI